MGGAGGFVGGDGARQRARPMARQRVRGDSDLTLEPRPEAPARLSFASPFVAAAVAARCGEGRARVGDSHAQAHVFCFSFPSGSRASGDRSLGVTLLVEAHRRQRIQGIRGPPCNRLVTRPLNLVFCDPTLDERDSHSPTSWPQPAGTVSNGT